MMHDNWMWGMGGGSVIGLAIVVLVLAALVKYVFFK
jgi:hypothetical protein